MNRLEKTQNMIIDITDNFIMKDRVLLLDLEDLTVEGDSTTELNKKKDNFKYVLDLLELTLNHNIRFEYFLSDEFTISQQLDFPKLIFGIPKILLEKINIVIDGITIKEIEQRQIETFKEMIQYEQIDHLRTIFKEKIADIDEILHYWLLELPDDF